MTSLSLLAGRTVPDGDSKFIKSWLLENNSGSIFGDGTLEGTLPASRSYVHILGSEMRLLGEKVLASEDIRSHGENFLGSVTGRSSSVKAEPESFEGVSESGLV